MEKRIAVMLDGGHLRVQARRAGKRFEPDYIEKIASSSAKSGEEIVRVLYYDCAPFSGEVVLPVSGERKTFVANDKWLTTLRKRICSPCAEGS
jgi:hypothetical protein